VEGTYLRKFGLVVLTVILQIAAASAQQKLESTNRTIQATRTTENISINGVMDEPAWQTATPVSDFIQTDPDEGKPGSEITRVSALYDEEALYIGFRCLDKEPDKIVKALEKRDGWTSTDKVQIEIDSHNDHTTSFFFEVNASGVKRDAFRSDDDTYDFTWDSVWEGDVRVGADGYCVEFRIPFTCLRFAESPEMQWGINFSRWIIRKQEYDAWNFKPNSVAGEVAHFGHIENLKGIRPARHLEILPYIVSSRNTEPKSPGNNDGLKYYSNTGVDLKYGLASNITLDATINPDFGQVEVDPAVINLSTFETYYEEKRPFFIEGADNFSTPFNLFYSRRIGRAPRGSFDDVDYYIDNPQNTTILGAAKVTGKTRSGWEIGFLDAVCSREKASYFGTDGLTHKAISEEAANYQISRIKKEFQSGSSIGVITTSANQLRSTPVYSGGIDWRLYFDKRMYSFSGQAIGSREGPQQNGRGAIASFDKEGGDHVRGDITWEYKSKNLNLNRLGFLNRANIWTYSAWVQYRTSHDFWIIRNTYNNFNYWYGENLQGQSVQFGGNFNHSIEFKNNWMWGSGFAPDFPHYDDRETRGGPLFKVPYTWAYWTWIESPARNPISIYFEPQFGTNIDGTWRAIEMTLTMKPKENLSFSLGPEFELQDNVSRWVAAMDDSLGRRVDVFGKLDLRRLDINIRSTMIFTRTMTLQLYSQLYFATGDYSDFRELVPPDKFRELTVAYDGNPDFNYKSFNFNAVFRWEYYPGSTFYLVWTQARQRNDDFGDFRFKRDFGDMFDTQSDNVILAKINFWWNP
jgi:hypothetical protein